MKNRLKGAQKGHSLLKRKAEALTRKFREIVTKIRDAKLKMGKVLQVASFSYAEVAYIAGDIRYSFHFLFENQTITNDNPSSKLKSSFEYNYYDFSFQVREGVTTAQTRVKARQENVSGVLLPCFDMVSANSSSCKSFVCLLIDHDK